MLEFKRIELNDIEIYKKYAKDCGELSCENNFINLLVWQCSYNNMMAVKDGILFIKVGVGDNESFRLPIGGDLKKGIEMIYRHCDDKKPRFWLQDCDRLQEFIEIYSNDFSLKEIRDSFDYLYLRKNLAELSGKKYHSKRNHINTFTKKYNWHYEAITPQNIAAVKKCAEKWYFEKADKMDEHMECEKKGLETILNNMEILEARGGAIFVDGDVVAFTIGSPISDDAFDIHIEKALSDYAEGYTVINREFAKNELSDYKYINREDDMGIEGLRKAKLSYNPEILLKKYVAR